MAWEPTTALLNYLDSSIDGEYALEKVKDAKKKVRTRASLWLCVCVFSFCRVYFFRLPFDVIPPLKPLLALWLHLCVWWPYEQSYNQVCECVYSPELARLIFSFMHDGSAVWYLSPRMMNSKGVIQLITSHDT